MVRQYSRSTATPNDMLVDKPLYQMPDWKCFCCQDTGTILEPSIRTFGLIPDYNSLVDKPVLCKREGCVARHSLGSVLLAQGVYGEFLNVDDRVEPDDCEEIHSTNRQFWLATVLDWGQRKNQMRDQGDADYNPVVVDQTRIYAGVTGITQVMSMPVTQPAVGDDDFARAILNTEVEIYIDDEPTNPESSTTSEATGDTDDDW
jgi:hypothetical protein